MAPLRNPKHEAFVHNYLKCGDATEAFALTGYTRDSANANRLLKRPQVQAQLRELQDEIAAKVPITIESLIAELEEVRVAAGSKNQFTAAVRAVLGKAQLAGLLVDRSKVEVTNADPFAGMENTQEIYRKTIDDIYEFKFAAYHDYRDEDRQYLAQLMQRRLEALSAEMDAYVAEIHARPHKTVNLMALPLTTERQNTK
jgi:phage terminase small subunit